MSILLISIPMWGYVRMSQNWNSEPAINPWFLYHRIIIIVQLSKKRTHPIPVAELPVGSLSRPRTSQLWTLYGGLLGDLWWVHRGQKTRMENRTIDFLVTFGGFHKWWYPNSWKFFWQMGPTWPQPEKPWGPSPNFRDKKTASTDRKRPVLRPQKNIGGHRLGNALICDSHVESVHLCVTFVRKDCRCSLRTTFLTWSVMVSRCL